MARRPTLTGDVQLRNNLRKISEIYTGRTLDQDIEHSLEPLQEQTEANARRIRNFAGKYSNFFPQPSEPRKGGHLDEGVVSKRVANKGKYNRTWWVSFRNRARKIAHLAEFGTAPHWQPRFKGGWMHPGARPHPFFRPAFEAKKGAVIDRLANRARFRLLTAVQRMRNRTK